MLAKLYTEIEIKLDVVEPGILSHKCKELAALIDTALPRCAKVTKPEMVSVVILDNFDN